MGYEGVSLCSYSNTRSKELIDSFHKLGMGISYSNALILRDAWTLIVVPCVLMRLIREGTAKYQYDEITNLNQCRITVSFNLRQTPFSFLHMLYCEIGYSGPIVADTDSYAPISQKLPGLLCKKRKQETILCRNLVPEEMADCNWMSCQLRVL